MKNIDELMNISFFKFFKEISDIPRESGNEKQISDYLVEFAVERNLEVYQDEYNNVVIKKQSSKGYENIPPVILQGHMDMVCEKVSESKHDFSKDPLKLEIKGDMIYAKGTTLGSDDGVALAYSLAILDSNDLNHPRLEVIFTTEEETTMSGAINLDTSNLEGKIMINLDSDKDNKLLVSSTGGVIAIQNIDINLVDKNNYYNSYEICVDGLIGGHSGEEIHKERGNANKIIGRVLNEINKKTDMQLSSIYGGTSSNAIAREAKAIIHINNDEEIYKLVDKINDTLKREYSSSDKNLNISIKGIEKYNDKKVICNETLNKLINLLILIPNGVQSMSANIEGLVESSNNLGVVRTNKDYIQIECEIRSCVKSKRKEIEERIIKICELCCANYSTRDEYPEWNYKSDSIIREIFKESYKKLYNEEIMLEAVHAGLETGVFIEKMPYLDVISYGPNAYELHNPQEHMSISSCLKTWDMLVEVLENTINYKFK